MCRLALWWLRDQGYERLGLLGTSLGSCLSYLTTAHEPLVRAQALNHVSPYFGDVVWRGLSTEHVREGLEGHVDVDQLRELWRPISPWSFVDRLHDKKTLMVYAKYDLTFPVDLSLQLIEEIHRRGYSLDVRMLPCGHYSTGVLAVQVSRRAGIWENFSRRNFEQGSKGSKGSRRSKGIVLPRFRVRTWNSARTMPLELLEPLEPLEPRLEVLQQAHNRVVDRSGERLDQRRHFAGVHRFGHRDRIRQQQPHRGARNDRCEQPDDADEAEQPVGKA